MILYFPMFLQIYRLIVCINYLSNILKLAAGCFVLYAFVQSSDDATEQRLDEHTAYILKRMA